MSDPRQGACDKAFMNIKQENSSSTPKNELHWAKRLVLSRAFVGLRRELPGERNRVYDIFYYPPANRMP